MRQVEPTVRLTESAQQWLDTYTAAQTRLEGNSGNDDARTTRVIREVHRAWRAQPGRSPQAIVDVVAHTTGFPASQVIDAIEHGTWE